MYYYHFKAEGYRQGAGEFCSDAAAAERIAFEIFLEMSACAKRVVIVTVTNSEGAEISRVPRLSESDIAYLSVKTAI
jgi:hypothetical protein